MAKIQFCLIGKTLVEFCREFPEVVAEAIEWNNRETAPSTDVQQGQPAIMAQQFTKWDSTYDGMTPEQDGEYVL